MAYKSVKFRQSNGRRLGHNEFSIRWDGTAYLHFSTSFSEELEKKGWAKMDIRQDDITGKIGFWFNKNEGLNLTGGYCPEVKTYSCNNREAIKWIFKTLNIEGNRAVLKLSNNLSIHPDGDFYEVIGRVK